MKKSIPDTKKIISEQIEKLGEAQKDLEKTMNEINFDLTRTMNEVIVKGEVEKSSKGKCECGEDCVCEE